MSGGLLKGPLPLVVVATVVVLVYKYVPFGDILARFERPDAEQTVTAPPASVPQPSAGSAAVEPSTPSAPAVEPPAVSPAATPSVPRVETAEVLPPSAPVAAAPAEPPSGPAGTVAAPVEASPVASEPAVSRRTVQPATADAPRREPTGTVGTVAPASPAASPVSAARPSPSAPAAAGAVARPAPAPAKPASPPATTVAKVDRPAAAPRVPIEPPAKPRLRIFVEADTHERAGLGHLSAAEYAGMLRGELLGVAADYLGGENVQRDDENLAFRDALAGGRAGIDALCERAQVPRVLLADVSVPSAGFSSIPSAYWPEVVFTAISCADGRVHKSQRQRLEPHRLDRFEYQQLFAQRSQTFVASQGYFLRP